MLIYVLNRNGQPLMPTDRCGKVRRLLNAGKAKAVKRCPFTIQLLYENTGHTQPVSLGVDAGSKTVGLSATTKKKVLFESELTLRNDITELLSARRESRRTRRNNKTRYRKPRFLNRVHSKHKGWLAPSVENKILSHLKIINDIRKILPVTDITVETASFDIQKINNPDIGGTQYQEGDQLGFWNVREYVLHRDGHTCQCCRGKSKDPVLNVHHIESRKTGGNAPNNLITLCESCHKGFHKGDVKLPESIRRGKIFKDAAFMGIMRWTLYNCLKEISDIPVHMTYGYITKNTRITNGLPKEHFVDARCISGNPLAVSDGTVYIQKKIRCHNRQIHKRNITKGGSRKKNQSPYLVKGFRLFDKVRWNGKICFIFGRRSSGYFDIRFLDGTKVHAGISSKKLRFIDTRHSCIWERRTVCFPPAT